MNNYKLIKHYFISFSGETEQGELKFKNCEVLKEFKSIEEDIYFNKFEQIRDLEMQLINMTDLLNVVILDFKLINLEYVPLDNIGEIVTEAVQIRELK